MRYALFAIGVTLTVAFAACSPSVPKGRSGPLVSATTTTVTAALFGFRKTCVRPRVHTIDRSTGRNERNQGHYDEASKHDTGL